MHLPLCSRIAGALQARYVAANEKYQDCIQVEYDRYPNDHKGPAATARGGACSVEYTGNVP